MSELENALRPRYSNKKQRSTLGYSVGSLLLAGFNLLIWLFFFLPAYLIRDSSLVDSGDGLKFSLILFMIFNVVGMGLGLYGVIKSKRNKEAAIFGLVANALMIGLNLSLVMPYGTLAGHSEINNDKFQQQTTNNDFR